MTKLGQNFLISKRIAEKMADSAETGPKDVVLEIGPGRGILTGELLKRAKKVVAVEKDAALFDFLKQKFAEEIQKKRLVLIKDDIRDFLKNPVKHPMFNIVVANIPYYLTGQLLRLLLSPVSDTRYPTIKGLIILMLQKEVAQRMVSDTRYPTKRKMSLLAISVWVCARPKIAFLVKKGNFWPQPKVDSAVVVFKRRERDFFKEHKISQKAFFDIVKAGFAHPRKVLKNNLALSDIGCLIKCGVEEKARAEDLSLENWACLVKSLSKL